MLLQPRSFIYKRRQKKRRFLFSNNSQNALNFGGAGLMILKPVQLTANQLFRFKLFLKRSAKKSDRTRRFVWFHAFPHLPLTQKPNGVRMGKGKGKVECWFTSVPGGTMLIEFQNLRKGRASFFISQMTHKLGIPTKPIFAINNYLNFPLKNSKRVCFRVFW